MKLKKLILSKASLPTIHFMHVLLFSYLKKNLFLTQCTRILFYVFYFPRSLIRLALSKSLWVMIHLRSFWGISKLIFWHTNILVPQYYMWKTCLFLLKCLGTFIENQLVINWVFLDLSVIPLIWTSILTLIWHSCYHSFVVSFEIR